MARPGKTSSTQSTFAKEIERGRLEAKEEKLVDQDEIEVRMQRWLAE